MDFSSRVFIFKSVPPIHISRPFALHLLNTKSYYHIPVAEFIDPWLGDKVNSGIGLSYRSGVDLVSPVRIYEFGYRTFISRSCKQSRNKRLPYWFIFASCMYKIYFLRRTEWCNLTLRHHRLSRQNTRIRTVKRRRQFPIRNALSTRNAMLRRQFPIRDAMLRRRRPPLRNALHRQKFPRNGC